VTAAIFTPGSHLTAREGDRLEMRSNAGGLLLTCSKPVWMDTIRICARYELPSRIVLPLGISCVVEFDRVVDAMWSVMGVDGVQHGRIIQIPAFEKSGVGFFGLDGMQCELVIAPFAAGDFENPADLLSPFRFDGGRCSSAVDIEFGYENKEESHFFHGVGASKAITINGVSNAPLLLNFGDVHTISFSSMETGDDTVVASSPRMDTASVVCRLKAGLFRVEQPLSGSKRLWYGKEGSPYSGGVVNIRSSPAFGVNWASCLGKPPPAISSFRVPSSGDFCLLNIASLHSWCCSTLEVRRKDVPSGSPRPTACSGLAAFDGLRWLPRTGMSRIELSARMQESARDGSLLCLIEPGVMDGSFRAGNHLMSFCREFANRFSQSGLLSFAAVMADGLSSKNIDTMKGSIDLASANTGAGTSIAVFISRGADEDALSALRLVAGSHHRSIYGLVMDVDTAVVAENFGINMLVPEYVAPLLSVQAGRQVVVFDSASLVRSS
jgi:hypothetical protein